jgi:hypothetical protein
VDAGESLTGVPSITIAVIQRRYANGKQQMKYRGVEYYVAQGVEVGTWRFSTSMNDKIRKLRAKNRQEAAKAVEQRIEKELAPKKRRLLPPASK